MSNKTTKEQITSILRNMQVKNLQLKRTLRSVLFILLLGVAGVTKGYAYDFSAVCSTGQTLYYNIIDADNHYVALTYPGGGIKYTGSIILPESVQNEGVIYSVISIGSSAFSNCTGLTSIEIPNSVTSIDNLAFFSCSSLSSIEIPNSVTSIGSYAFSYCHSLTSIEIPNSVTSIGNYAFCDCISATSIEIPNSVTSIGNNTFSGCSSITSIEIPNSVTSIGNYAFSGCSNLTSIEIPNSVTSIGDYAFCNCSSLTSIEIPNSVTSIGESAFSSCISLTTIEIPNSVTSIGESAFSSCSSLTTIEIPNSVTSIGSQAFSSCSSLTSMTVLADNPPTLGNYVFYQVNSFILVYVPCSSIESYQNAAGWNVFTNMKGLCSGEVSVTINPAEGGTVTGAGYYNGGELCVLTATSNPGFILGNWTENGMVVSTNMVYSFYAHPTSIVAHFVPEGNIIFSDANVKSLCVANWDIDGDGELSYAEAAAVTSLGNVFHNQSSISSFNELQYFIGLNSIGEQAFRNCSSLTSIEIPNSVIFVETNLFEGCSGLGQIVVEAGNTVYDSRDNCNAIIKSSTNELIRGCKNTIIPNSVTSIGESAFSSCSSLTSIEIPNSVTSIGDDAFRNCSSLTSIEIPNSVTYIGGWAFYNCSSLTSIVIPNSVTHIGGWMIEKCSGLEQIVVEEGNTVYDSRDNCNAIIHSRRNELWCGCKNTIIPNSVTSIGNVAFHNCTGLISIVIPNSVTSIGDDAFGGCTGLSSIEISNSVTSIGNWAFEGCTGLTSIEIPNSVTSIGNWAFEGCTGLTSIEIPNSVTSIGRNAFEYCTGLTSVEISNSVTSIDQWTFYHCSSLTSIEIPNSVTSIGNYAFCDCISATSIEIPNSVTSIGDYAFCGCNSLTSLEIPNSLTSIGFNAFAECSSLTSIEISSSVTSIGQSAFSDCTGLTSITVLADNPPALGGGAFQGVNNSIPVYVPCGSLEAYSSISWGRFTNFVEMCGGTVTLSVDPEEGGAVTGGGTYGENSFCTVTATANEGYRFVAWTEDGEVVSTDASYRFPVTGDRTLTANFDPYYHWTPVDEGVYSYSMVLIGVVLIDGEEQYSDQLELGIFCGEECRATCRLEEFYITGRYLAWTNVYGEEGDELTFRLYDHSSGMELALTPPASVVFTEDGYGTPIEPYELNFYSSVTVSASVSPVDAGTVEGAGEYVFGTSCTLVATANPGFQFQNWTENNVVVSSEATYSFEVTVDRSLVAHFGRVQTSPLVSGWNWWSTYIEQEGIDGLQMLENSLDGNGLRIQAKTGSTDYFEYQGTGYWYGSLNAIVNEQMYKIRTSAECEAVMVGEETLPANHPITLNNGWSWIGYPCGQSVSLEDAMSDFTPDPDDVIKGRNSSSVFVSYNGYNLWYGTLNTLQPGQGYMYKSNSNETKTLVFNPGSGNREVKSNITPEGNRFVPANENYSDNMLVTAVIDMGGMELRSGDYELAAFVGDECRGSVKLMYVEPFDRYEAFLLVYGNGSETLRFVLTDGTEASQSDDHILYESDGIVGTASEPVTLHFGPLGVEDDSFLPVNIYPNPSKGIFNLEGVGIQKIEVMDTYGQVILSQEVENDFLQINLSDKARGVYLLRVVTTQGITTKKVLVTE